jgi:hypothetical protein
LAIREELEFQEWPGCAAEEGACLSAICGVAGTRQL